MTINEELAQVRHENKVLRRMLAVVHGVRLGLDHDELVDETQQPSIDWQRDPWPLLKQKLGYRAANENDQLRASLLVIHKP